MSRVAVVTGAGRGSGAAVVARLAGQGWRAGAVDRCADLPGVGYPLGTRAELEAVAAPWPDTVRPVVADVRSLDALTDAVALAEREFGGLDAAVAAAAVMAGGRPLWETTDAEWDALFETGVRGVANLARAAVPVMLRRPSPRTRSEERPVG